MTEDRAVGAPERLHPLFLLTGLGGSLRGVLGGWAAVGYLGVSGRLSFALLLAAAMLVLLAASVFLYWRRFEYRVGEDEIRIDSGIFSRTHRSIPFDRVQDVDITQGPVARLFGLAQVKFETGSASAQNPDEGVLQAITLARAEQLRLQVRAHRSGVTAAVPATDAPDAPPLFAMDGKRVLLAGVFNFSLALFAGLFGASQSFGNIIGFDPLSRSFWLQLVNAGDPIAQYVLAHRIAAVTAGLALLVLAGLATGLVRTVLREYGFRVDRAAAGLRRRRGLVTRTDVTLPVARIQAAIVATGPVRDTFGWRELKLQSLAQDEGGKGDHVLAPLARDPEVATLLAELGWSLPTDAGWRPVSRAFVWTLALGLAPLALIALGQMLFFPALGLAALAVLGAILAIRWLAWRRTAFAFHGDLLLVRSGWWRRRLLVLPRRRIQSIDLSENFIGRRFGIAALAFGVAGGSGYSAHAIPALPRETARDLRQRLLGSAA
ncbi:PH domain-containing protein [Sphingomonas sp.]|uniref:PH domain-containing protein n=1 Tax=Sphingomonas sp. TaxID=28214 RepID=UPI00286DEFCF|nr:PH domain-containing protein [Sphingomonas sp.]